MNIDIEIIGQEEYVGPFRADILGKDITTDRYIIIENQFGKTDHSHLGQIITYASGLSATTIIWISEKFTEEPRSALDWLNNITEETVEFFGVEIELFKIGDSAPAPRFNIISKPNNWSKTIKRKSTEAGLTETKLIQQEYWQSFKDYISTQKVSFKMQKPLPQHWTNIAIGKSDYKVCAIANTRDKWLRVQLVVFGDNGLEHFKKLKELYFEDAKKNLSPEIEWAEKEGGKEHHVNYFIPNTDPLNKKDWPVQHQLLMKWVDKFVIFFKDKIKDL